LNNSVKRVTRGSKHLQLYVEESALFVLCGKSFGALCERE